MKREILRVWLSCGAAIVLALVLGAGGHLEPFHTYLYLFAWPPFLFALHRTARARGARDLSPGGLPFLFAASTTVWLLFEAINFRLLNWRYVGLPDPLLIRWPGYAASFATVLPGLFWSARAFLPREAPSSTGRPPGAGAAAMGAAMLALVLVWPKYFFPLTWGAGFFLAEPLAARWGGRSLIAEWRVGDFRWTRALLGGGLACGLFWEACNFGAGAKWIYDVPFVGKLKIFEMPALGFLGFPPFALEAHAIFEAMRPGWRKLSAPGRAAAAALTAALWLLIFHGIDALTRR
ncbi:MAG: hypothetical protein JO102_03405 [Elusimicrobia bacterium]|nr:hypothetical protein [Elusimicrobiota bacterium]